MKDKELRRFLGVHPGGWHNTDLCGCSNAGCSGELQMLWGYINKLEARILELEHYVEERKAPPKALNYPPSKYSDDKNQAYCSCSGSGGLLSGGLLAKDEIIKFPSDLS